MASKAKTIADFKAAHDPDVIVPTKIRAALASLVKEGAENWEYELDFAKRAGINNTQLGAYRDQFSDHIVLAANTGRTPKRAWVGDAKVAKKLRGEK